MPTCAFVTLGCKVNQHDTQAIREDLAHLGWGEAPPPAPANLYVVNTCCVTGGSHRKSLRLVRQIARQHPGAAIIVTGCSVETDPERFRAIPGVAAVVGNAGKAALGQTVRRLFSQADVPEDPLAARPWPSISTFAGHTRAFVKVEDGCNDFCAYCIVPHVRGRVRSRPPDEVAEEVRRLVGNGYLEVVLTGIHLGAYGLETGGDWSLLALLERLAATPGLRRLRLSSLELREVTDELIALVAGAGVLCPHFHIPLQSGDDAVLRAMNRRYTSGDFLSRLDAVRSRIAEAALTTDVIVGFPGETDEQFRRTIEVAQRAGFSRMHVFPYSDREGTAASRMSGKVPREVIVARRGEMIAVGRELAQAYHRRFVGRIVKPLVESRRDQRTGLLCGYTERYVRTLFDGPEGLGGRIVEVLARTASGHGVEGEIVMRDT